MTPRFFTSSFLSLILLASACASGQSGRSGDSVKRAGSPRPTPTPSAVPEEYLIVLATPVSEAHLGFAAGRCGLRISRKLGDRQLLVVSLRPTDLAKVHDCLIANRVPVQAQPNFKYRLAPRPGATRPPQTLQLNK